MADDTASDIPRMEQVPDNMRLYTVLKALEGSGGRQGKLAIPARKPIETPHYIGVTSRGVIPHLTQDNVAKQTNISGVYVSLEDCMESSIIHQAHEANLCALSERRSHREGAK